MSNSCRNVVVVGSGIVGLTTAWSLCKAGWETTVVSAGDLRNTVSWWAGAFWFPFLVNPPAKASKWACAAYEIMKTQVDAQVPGIAPKRLRALFRQPKHKEDWWDKVNGFDLLSSSQLTSLHPFGYEFDSFVLTMPEYLTWLRSECEEMGVKFLRRQLASLSELSENCIVNCSGLGSKELVGDEAMYSIRGELLRYNQVPSVNTVWFCPEEPDHPKYYIPRKSDIIVGGSARRVGETAVGAQVIASAARDFFGVELPEHADEVAEADRPGRPQVRLSLEISQESNLHVLHNYGHGGAGVTIAWGCAADAVRMLENA